MNNFTKALSTVLLRDLDKLEQEILLYPNAQSIWTIKGDIKNSAGNLCLHLCGNLQHFIGTILGNSGYVRDREKEFSLKDLPASELVKLIAQTKTSISQTLAKFDVGMLAKDYPIVVFDGPMNTQYFLIHLAGHLNYHLGQVNYHRRLIAAKD